ncbi:uncharacterized protein EV420DRAFT_1566376 [Desarmillaria tabescens]|uniref:Uncharacterized protein n=1 Tax=Armillaria tabescens TaxID=1929756 RepID=A0AA39JUD3_ARMTA|nr:uncharacterized protein EV420DRAFT_1566376 [Desarmillaria tabescens]KAK0448958.1 hypothetical protein EV420DRAFT_1566376 [Desarmillaria tabescens]
MISGIFIKVLSFSLQNHTLGLTLTAAFKGMFSLSIRYECHNNLSLEHDGPQLLCSAKCSTHALESRDPTQRSSPAAPMVSPLVPDSTFFDVFRVYRSFVKRTAVMCSGSPQSMRWIYYGTMVLHILALWVLYMFSVPTFSLFGYLITSPVPSPVDYSDLFWAGVSGTLVLSPAWLLLIWVILRATIPVDTVSTRVRQMCHVIAFQVFFVVMVVASMTANIVVGVLVKGGNTQLDGVHAARVGAVRGGLMCFCGFFIVLFFSLVLCAVKRCTTH